MDFLSHWFCRSAVLRLTTARDGTLGTGPGFSHELYHLKERHISASQVCVLFIYSKTGYVAAKVQIRTF